MHIDSQWKDHGLLTQLHGSFHPFNIKIENSKTNFYSRSKTNFHSRSKTNEGKEKLWIKLVCLQFWSKLLKFFFGESC